MLVSYRWLARHVDLSGITPEEVAGDLTTHTAEVEGLEPFAPALSDVVVGHVVEHARHPNADKLSLCRVDLAAAGSGELVQIVCGASNVGEGQKVAVARVGTLLPGGTRIKKTKIRGEVSLGMICSERELELGDEQGGIWVLPPEAEVGLPVAEAIGARDWILEIDNKSVTHRPDLWGHRGLAGEIAAIRGLDLAPLDLTLPGDGGGEPYPVRVETEGCPRYLGVPIDGVRNEPSPTWLKLLLLAAGQRPLDLLVDLSNFVMLDLGQPNHLFDRRRLSAEGIVVRDARPGETMETLDGFERTLTPADMLICSGDEPVAIAGVMGGLGSRVGQDTGELLLEVASFHAATVRRTAMRLGLRTEASARFEKSLDPTLCEKAAAHLIRTLGGIQPEVTLPRTMGDAGSWSDPARRVRLRPARVRAVLGVDVGDDEIEQKLTRLGFGVERGKPWTVAVPSARATKDIAIEEDLIEEVGRLHGYGKIPERPLRGTLAPPPPDERRLLVRRIQDRLAGSGRFHEVYTYSFLPEDVAERFGVLDEPHVEAVNPVLESWSRIRRGVMPSLLALLEDNLRRRERVRLFEIAKGYWPEHPGPLGEPREVQEVGLLWAAAKPDRGDRFDANPFSRLQGVLEDLLAHLCRPIRRWERAAQWGAVPPWAHPGRSLVGFAREAGDGEPVCVLGVLEPGLARALGVEEAGSAVAAACVSVDRILAEPEAPHGYRPLERYPGIKVDVALAVGADAPAGDVAAAIEAAGKGLVAGWELFDLYEGDSIGAGRKSLAFHVVLRADDRTLSDKDEKRFLERLERAIGGLGGELRRE